MINQKGNTAKPGMIIGQGRRRSIMLLATVVALVLLAPAVGRGKLPNPDPGKTPRGRPNRLAHEASPYLRQHAYNPVNWYPWGAEALDRARREKKPIFLSIGYSACHWCHVMAHECFENPQIARIMNENFINIKVDREERPDLDEIYMKAVQMLTGQGGWPLSVFLTPDLKPFYGGTYFPPEDRGAMPGFRRLLLKLSQTNRRNQKLVTGTSRALAKRLQTLEKIPQAGQEPYKDILSRAYRRLNQDFDGRHGGFGGAPKFPEALELGFLLNYYRYTGETRAQEIVSFTLDKMARGGLFDQLGGGFHRYAVDAAWRVPHFEKMLYTNALLVPLYLTQYQITGSALGRRVARETLEFVMRDLGAPGGGFYAALDADSEGQEGKYYVWSLAEVKEVVGAKAAPLVIAALGITPAGNFEGVNVLTRPWSEAKLAARFSLSREKVGQLLNPALDRLLQVRAERVPPARDDKIITAWNGLMISALAQGAQVLGDPRYYRAADRGARFILKNLCQNGRLYRIWANGQVSVPGFLDDYAFLVNGLLDLYETDFDPYWLTQAKRLVDQMEELFLDSTDGAYFYVGQDQKATLVRSKSIYDKAIPSGNSLTARACWRLYRFTEDKQYQNRARAILTRLQGQVQRIPLGFCQLLAVQTLTMTLPLDITLVGDPHHPKLKAMLKEIYRYFQPERRLILKSPKNFLRLGKIAPAAVPYPLSETPAAYICLNFACQPAITEPQALATRLKQMEGKKGLTSLPGQP